MRNRCALIVIAVVATFVLSACETAKGLGRDITSTAEAVERAL